MKKNIYKEYGQQKVPDPSRMRVEKKTNNKKSSPTPKCQYQ